MTVRELKLVLEKCENLDTEVYVSLDNKYGDIEDVFIGNCGIELCLDNLD